MIVVMRADVTDPVKPGQVRAEDLLDAHALAARWETDTAPSRTKSMRAGYLDTADDRPTPVCLRPTRSRA